MSTQLDQVLAQVQATSTQLTTDVDTLITMIQNGDPNALATAQAIQASLQSLDTAVQGAEAPPPAPQAGPSSGSH